MERGSDIECPRPSYAPYPARHEASEHVWCALRRIDA
jgi:hypothetical protein